jgi:hypothetical protein
MRIARLICSLMLAVGLLTIPVESRAQLAVGISVRIGPPVLPVYLQPICAEPGYIWVPGTWVEPPEVRLLWTPGYWACEDGIYVWTETTGAAGHSPHSAGRASPRPYIAGRG